ncbi:MAG: TonB-dependent receptor domain-containing protein, partial [Terriglobia bacterium]
HVFSPTVINQARFSYSRPRTRTVVVYFNEKYGQAGPGNSLIAGQPLGEVIVGELTEWNPGGNDPTEFNQRVFTWSDDVFYTRGAHSLKFGGLINNFEQFLIVNHDRKGVLEFPDIETFLTGRPSSFSGATPGSVFNRQMRFSTFGFYAQDDWRVRPGLTLNLGLRYEFSNQQNEVSGANVALRNITDNQGTRGIPFENSSKRNFSPRFGFAWDVFGNSTTALRGGFGLLYDLGNMGNAFRSGSIVPPLGSLLSLGEEDLQGPFTLPLSIPPGREGRSFEILDFHLKQPRLYQWNLTVERQFPWEMALSVSYRGSRGVRLLQLREGNPTTPQIRDGQRFWTGNESRINPNWEDIVMLTAGGGYWYNGLQVGLSKRATHGLQFQTSYT